MNDMGLNLAYNAVKEFHIAFNHPVSTSPSLLNKNRVKIRNSWIMEELHELEDANNIVEQSDAIIDAIYFLIGTLVEMGIKPQNLFDIVQEANMSKLWPDGKPRYRDDGKILKPVSWIAPEPRLIKEIERQIEEGTK